MPILHPGHRRAIRERDRLLADLRAVRRQLAEDRADSAPLAHDLARARRETTAIARALRTWLSRPSRNTATLRALLVRLERVTG